MSNSASHNDDLRELDFGNVSRPFKNFSKGINNLFARTLRFLKRNIWAVAVIIIAGAAFGLFLDGKKRYDNSIIVLPNFGSVDYLYGKIDLLNSKISEGDTAFIKQLGIKNPKAVLSVKIAPIVDVYDFVNQRESNFEMVKIMSEDGAVSKVLEDRVTSKNYPKHQITFVTKKSISRKDFVDPLMAYLNNSEYFQQMKNEHLRNLDIKMKANDSIIRQIDGIFKGFSSNRGDGKLMFYNEDTQLNELIKSKDQLISEQGGLRINRVNFSDIIKESSVVLNQEKTGGAHGLMVIIMPIMLLLFFGFAVVFFKLAARALKQN